MGWVGTGFQFSLRERRCLGVAGKLAFVSFKALGFTLFSCINLIKVSFLYSLEIRDPISQFSAVTVSSWPVCPAKREVALMKRTFPASVPHLRVKGREGDGKAIQKQGSCWAADKIGMPKVKEEIDKREN